MATLHFTPHLERRLDLQPMQVQGSTVREALDDAFGRVERARGYVLDDQGAVRHHVAVFVDGVLMLDRQNLAAPIRADSEIWIMQALSGG